MTVSVKKDLFKNSSVTRTFDTLTVVRSCFLEAIPLKGEDEYGSPQEESRVQLDALAYAALAGIGYADSHPDDADLLASEFRINPPGSGSLDKVELFVTYIKHEFPHLPENAAVLYSWESALGSETLDHDKNNNPVTSKWYNKGIPGSPVTGNYKTASGGTLSVLKPNMTLLVRKWVNIVGSSTATLEAYILGGIGTVNDATWHSGAPYTWMCQDIKADSTDGMWYLLEHRFMYKPLTWWGFMAYEIDGHRPPNLYRGYDFSSYPPTELNTNNGFKIVDNYPAITNATYFGF